jgi:CheY-like chemotaxis protein
VHIDRKIPKILIGDEQRLSQVIINLLVNATKFTGEGGFITLDARFLEEKDNLCTLQIAVIDTGIGISAQQQEKLFHSFHQAESGTTRKFGGMGLGLAISKSIVEKMGGSIWIQSEEKKGSTFAFTIKMKRGNEKKHYVLPSGVNLNNVSILMVDNDPDVLEYTEEIVKKLRISCDIAINGKDALRLVGSNGPYSIYFVDWKLSDVGSMELISKLKETSSNSDNTVILMVSSSELNTIEEAARNAGVDKFLLKPVSLSAVMETIYDCLGVDQGQIEDAAAGIDNIFADRRIMLVEDVEINREIILVLLEPTNITIDCAENGIEAVNMFKEAQGRYDLIFMDVQMPEMDGYDATRLIRQMDFPGTGTIPIIAMTANVFKEDIDKCFQAGMNGHIGKPLDIDDVLDKLRTHLT